MKSAKGLLLLSGGFDSPVAGFFAKEKGIQLSAVHFCNYPFTDSSPEEKARRLAEKLDLKELIVINLGPVLKELASSSERKFYFVLMKRLMLRVAEKLAEKKGIDFLITGENLGQVSSQTLSNLASIDSAAKIPVLRPLISFEKQEIIDFSKKIGTHDISVGPEMCDVLGPDKVAVKSSEKKLNELEKEINMKELLKDLLNSNSIN